MFNNIFKGKKVLVTGNTGFKGSWLTCWLLKLGAKVYGISNGVPSDPSMFKALDLESQITYFEEDIRDLPKTKKIIDEVAPDFLFHLAAQAIVSTSYLEPLETFSTNVMGTVNILDILRECNKEMVAVIITSDKCYDNVEWVWGYKETDVLGGKDVYSGSKGAAELAIKSYYHSFFKNSKVRIASVRAGNVIGGGDWAKDRIVPDCFRAWSQGRVVKIRNPKATRPWQHVLEPLSGYLTIAQDLYQNKRFSGESYNFGPSLDQNYTVLEILKKLAQIWGFSHQEAPFSSEADDSFYEAKLLKLNCDKALFDLSWTATLGYEETVGLVGSWYREYYRGKKTRMFEYTIKQIEQYLDLALVKKIVWTK